MSRTLTRRAALSLPLAAITASAGHAAGPPFQDRLDQVFGRAPDRAVGLDAFPRWKAVRRRHAHRPWLGAERLLADIRALNAAPPRAQLDRVQALVARAVFAHDIEVWGAPDVWATPGELMTWGGDCEDFAVAKFLALRELGWPQDSLRVTLVHDERYAPAREHALLLVRFDGRLLALDRVGPIARADGMPFYRPRVSVDERHIYLHGPL